MAGYAYGGFWIRFLARLIDGLISGIVFFILALVIGIPLGLTAIFTLPRNPSVEDFAPMIPGFILLILAVLGFSIAYEVYFLTNRGGTPGKLALGLRVIRADASDGDQPISVSLAVGRYFANWVTGLIPLNLGYIIAGFDAQKRAVHDHICSTRVISIR
jgi:uncharacterized RDD family membrane protein YckC